jgi:hypothetical protein
MQTKIRNLVLLTTLCGCAVLLLIGCGQSQSAADKAAPPEIHGEPIKPVQSSAAGQAPVAIANAAPVTASPIPHTKPVSAPAVIAAAVSPKAPEPKPASNDGGYQTVGFDKLASYNFEVLDDAPVTNLNAGPDKADDQIPARVKAFNEKKVSIRGFMLPLKVDNGKVTEFLIMKDQSLCCYGATPKINEWVSVKIGGRGIKPIMDQPVSMLGTLHVGAMRENGYLVGIYHMDGDKLIDTDDN